MNKCSSNQKAFSSLSLKREHTQHTHTPGCPDARGEGSANSSACQHNLLLQQQREEPDEISLSCTPLSSSLPPFLFECLFFLSLVYSSLYLVFSPQSQCSGVKIERWGSEQRKIKGRERLTQSTVFLFAQKEKQVSSGLDPKYLTNWIFVHRVGIPSV